jgi:hypothetical protein
LLVHAQPLLRASNRSPEPISSARSHNSFISRGAVFSSFAHAGDITHLPHHHYHLRCIPLVLDIVTLCAVEAACSPEDMSCATTADGASDGCNACDSYEWSTAVTYNRLFPVTFLQEQPSIRFHPASARRRGAVTPPPKRRRERTGVCHAIRAQSTPCFKQSTSHITRHTSHVTRHTSHVTRHTSHVTRHTSHVTHHTPHVARHTSQVKPKKLSLSPPLRPALAPASPSLPPLAHAISKKVSKKQPVLNDGQPKEETELVQQLLFPFTSGSTRVFHMDRSDRCGQRAA